MLRNFSEISRKNSSEMFLVLVPFGHEYCKSVEYCLQSNQ